MTNIQIYYQHLLNQGLDKRTLKQFIKIIEAQLPLIKDPEQYFDFLFVHYKLKLELTVLNFFEKKHETFK